MKNAKPTACKHEKGVAALEFALVFPVLFLVLYGILSYSLVFAAQHSLSQAAAEGARAAVRFQSSSDTLEKRKEAACTTARQGLVWLERMGGWQSSAGCQVTAANCAVPHSNPAQLTCLKVVLTGDFSRLIPRLLPLPNALEGQAMTHIALAY